jgi:CBS domain-containing protein
MKVKDAMHKGVTWVEPQTPVQEVASKMRNEDVGALPVGKNDRLVGMVTDRDIVCRGLANGSEFAKLTAADVMSKGIVYCRTEDDLEEALHTMEKHRIRRLPVLNEKKRMVGMLSLGDISQVAKGEMLNKMLRAVAAHHA